jgi:hypothetical protein
MDYSGHILFQVIRGQLLRNIPDIEDGNSPEYKRLLNIVKSPDAVAAYVVKGYLMERDKSVANR